MGYKSNIAVEFKEELLKNLKDEIEAIILYGSVARGEEGKESDIDVLVLVKNKKKEVYNRISRIRTETDLKYQTLTSLFVIDEEEFKKYIKHGSPFLSIVLKEGVLLYASKEFRRIRESIT